MLIIDTQVLLAGLFVLHLLCLIFGLREARLHTGYFISAGVLSSLAILASAVHSVLEDQRSVQPSDILVIYFSASTLLSTPRLRTLWLISSIEAPKIVWTLVFIGTVAVVFVESIRKTGSLQPQYKNATKEQTASFWSRGFFIWVLPFFRVGYSKVLELGDIPKVDDELEEDSVWAQLEAAWGSTRGPYRLIRATFLANSWSFSCAVVPRLALSVFTLCQPFLIESVVSYLVTDEHATHNEYGHALIGAFVLVYLGIAVSNHQTSGTGSVTKLQGPRYHELYTGDRPTA